MSKYERAARETQLEQRLHDELIDAIKTESLTSFCRRSKLDQTAMHRFLKSMRTLNLSTAGKVAEALGLKLGKPAASNTKEKDRASA